MTMGLLGGLRGLYNVSRGVYEFAHPDESAKTYFYTEFYKKQISEIEDCIRENGFKGDLDNISKASWNGLILSIKSICISSMFTNCPAIRTNF